MSRRILNPVASVAAPVGALSPLKALGAVGIVLGASAVVGRRNAPDPSHPAIRRWYRRLDKMRWLDRRGSITFVDATGTQTCPLDRADLLARFHAREDGGPLSGAAALAAMWRATPLLRPVGLIARNPVVLASMERLYLRFLRVRPRLQRWLARSGARA